MFDDSLTSSVTLRVTDYPEGKPLGADEVSSQIYAEASPNISVKPLFTPFSKQTAAMLSQSRCEARPP